MKRIGFVFCSAVLAVLFANISAASAEFAAHYEITNPEVSGDTVVGEIHVWVANNGNGDVSNVDMRVEDPRIQASDFGVLQFGALAAGEARALSSRFVGPAEFLDTGEPLVWRVDYDQADGTHAQTTVTAWPN